MKFYNRTKEIAILQEKKKQAYEDHSMFTVITGRRRIGKTSLILKALENETVIYLFVGRNNEADLCNLYTKEIEQQLRIFVPPMNKFSDIFQFLLEQGTKMKFSLVIDEFQEFININPSVYSDIQNYWDRYKNKTHINFVVSGSVYSLMTKIFQDYKEPLFGRADTILKLTPFTTSILKEILKDNNPNYKNDDLLALYTFTGGIAKYIEILIDNKALTVSKMIKYICQSESPFIEEGRSLLIQEFGKKYGSYFSILKAIALGKNTQTEIESFMGEKSIGGQLHKLETVYEVIKKQRPVFAKEGTQTVRFEITDNFLRFWFRYIERNRYLIEIGNFEELYKIILEDYPTYSGKTLELYFIEKMKESFSYRNIGSWWEPKDNQNEIDIVGVDVDNKNAVAIEIKRHKKNFKPELLKEKVKILQTKVLYKYQVKTLCLDLEDM
ncbi:MAG: ATP-binding protein [Candidatus Cryptobacteroides sp.]